VKRVLGIALALALALPMLVAAPVGAVSEGSIEVLFVPPCTNIAGANATYAVIFHNNELLLGDDNDYIDIDFPAGTVLAPLATVTVTAHATAAHARSGAPAVTLRTIAQGFDVTGRTVRIRLDDEAFILKSEWVRVELDPITNPASCDYTLQVGTSNQTSKVSAPYTIYTIKIDLFPIKNLISLPAYPRDTSIEVVLAALFARAAAVPTFAFSVWYWDAWEQEWVIYASDTSFNDLTDMYAGKAYFIKVNQAVSFKFKGDPYQECQGPPKKWKYPPSWSMIGIPTTDVTWASDYLFDTMLPWPAYNTYAVSTIFGFNQIAQQFSNTGWRPGQRDDSSWMEGLVHPVYVDVPLVPGLGYFMSFSDYSQIIPPVPGP